MTHELNKVFQLCASLSQKGLTPSVGLIRSKLTERVPLPMIIAGLKRWQSDPDNALSNIAEDARSDETDNRNNTEESDAKIAALEQRVRSLEAQLTNLQTVVMDLKQQ